MVHVEPVQIWLIPATAMLGELPCTPNPPVLDEKPFTPTLYPVVALALPNTPTPPVLAAFP
jgi:hypothetical protein